MTSRRDLDRRILALAAPTFLALVSEPLFLLADAAIVGHLGTVELAALGIAAVVLRAGIGLCIFLAYGTTAAVARGVGAGDRRGALRQGVDGLWLAVLLGLAGTAAGVAASPALVGLFDTTAAVARAATTYLQLAWLGLTPMLLVLAATGVLRGLSDARTPLYAAVAANLANIALNLLLVYPAGLGLPGSAIGTSLAQAAMAAYLVVVVVRRCRAEGVGLSPDLPGVRRVARAGGALVVRTLSLQATLLTATWAAASLGVVATATHQLAMAVWTFLAYVLDAVAIAAQTVTGSALGAGDVAGTRALTDRMIRLGLLTGVATGLVLLLVGAFLGPLFTDDPAVIDRLTAVLVVAALFQPVAGVVFVLDGVLIGAGDARYLAWAGVAVFLVAAPLLLLSTRLVPDAGTGIVWLWAAFGVGFMGSRAVLLVLRARGSAWMVTGAGASRPRGR